MFDEFCDLAHTLAQEIRDRSPKPMGMTRACRSSFCTHPKSTYPDKHTPLHLKTLDFTWFTATLTRLSSRSPVVHTACEEPRGDLCTAHEGTVRVAVCRFRSPLVPHQSVPRNCAAPSTCQLQHQFLTICPCFTFDIFSSCAHQNSRLGSSFGVPHRHRPCIRQAASTADAEGLAAGFVLGARGVCKL